MGFCDFVYFCGILWDSVIVLDSRILGFSDSVTLLGHPLVFGVGCALGSSRKDLWLHCLCCCGHIPNPTVNLCSAEFCGDDVFQPENLHS